MPEQYRQSSEQILSHFCFASLQERPENRFRHGRRQLHARESFHVALPTVLIAIDCLANHRQLQALLQHIFGKTILAGSSRTVFSAPSVIRQPCPDRDTPMLRSRWCDSTRCCTSADHRGLGRETGCNVRFWLWVVACSLQPAPPRRRHEAIRVFTTCTSVT